MRKSNEAPQTAAEQSMSAPTMTGNGENEREEMEKPETQKEMTSPTSPPKRKSVQIMENTRTRSGRTVKAPKRFSDYVQ